MADRVSVAITIGGTITAAEYLELAGLAALECLSTDWGGELFEPDHRKPGEALRLVAHEVAWGRLDGVEAWCIAHAAPFARWSGGHGCDWGAERVVFTGTGEQVSYDADENERILVDRHTVEKLGSLKAILAYFDAADFAVPPLIVKPDS